MGSQAVLHVTPVQGGGVDRHVRDVAGARRRAHLIWHAADRADAIEIPGERIHPVNRLAVTLDRMALVRWLAARGVGLVHAHSVNAPVRLRANWIAAALGVPTLVTLHDVLFLRRNAFEPGAPPEPDPAWLAETSPYIARAAAVVAPSEFLAGRARAAIPGLAVNVIPNGWDPPAATSAAAPHAAFASRASGPVVAVMGAIGRHKGSALLRELSALLTGSDFVVVVIGYLDGDFAPGWRSPHLFVHGPYDDRDAVALLGAYRARLALFPNIAPEGFSYTLSAVWSARVPALAAPGGALGERVSRYGGGWLLPERFTAADVARELRRLLSPAGAAELATVESRLSESRHERVPTIDAMRQSLEALYDRYGVDPRVPVDTQSDRVQGFLASQLDSSLFRDDLAILANELAQARAALAAATERAAALEREASELRVEKRAFNALPAALRKLLLKITADA